MTKKHIAESDSRTTLRLRPGGVMRCCMATLEYHQDAGGDEEIGTVLPCRYCRSSLIVAPDGWWQWNSKDAGGR